MKRRLFLTNWLVLLTCVVHGQLVMFSQGDFDYTVREDSVSVSLKAFDNMLAGDVIIPDSVIYQGKTFAVKQIESLGNNQRVISIRLPKTLNSMDTSCLYNLTGLLYIYVDAENPNYRSEDGLLIYKYTDRLIYVPRGRLGDLNIPEGIKEVDCNFYSGITKIVIPSTCTSIRPYGLSSNYATNLQEIEVAKENAVFMSANNMILTKDGKTLVCCVVGNRNSISIPETIDSLGYSAFTKSCKWLMERPTPPALYRYGISNSGVYVKADALSAYGSWGDKYSIYGYDFISDSILYAKKDNKELELVASLKQHTSLTLPTLLTDEEGDTRTITGIAKRAFYGMSSLRELVLPSALKTIGEYAFYDHSISSLSLPATLTTIGERAFYSYSLRSVFAEGSPAALGSYGFYFYNASLHVKGEYESAYREADNWRNFNSIIANDLTANGFAFKVLSDNTLELTKCLDEIESCTIPDKVSINGESYAITSIGDRAFYNQYELGQVSLPSKVKYIGADAFYGTSIASIKIPASCETIGERAFYIYQLKSVYAEGAPATLNVNSFYNSWNGKVLYVPGDYEELYKSSATWSSFFNTITANDYTSDGIVYKKTSANSVMLTGCIEEKAEQTIPDIVTIDGKEYKVTAIGERAFYNSAINDIKLPESLKVIGNYAFYGCRLKELDIPLSIDSIGDYAFGSNPISAVIVKHTVPFKIGTWAFSYNDVKFFIMNPNSVLQYKTATNWSNYTYIYGVDIVQEETGYRKISDTETALVACSKNYDDDDKLHQFEIPEKIEIGNAKYDVTIIADSAFYRSQVKNLTIPASVDSIGNRALYNWNYNMTITVKNPIPARINQNTFYRYYINAILVAPQSVDTFKVAYGWKNVADKIQSYWTVVDNIAYRPADDQRASVCYALAAPANRILEIPKEVVIGGNNYNVGIIESNAFNNANTKVLILPETIDSIGSLYLNSDLTYLKAQAPPRVGSTSTATILIPSSAKALYDVDPNWIPYTNWGVTTIGVDGIADSLIYKKEDHGGATIYAWLKAVNDTLDVPSTINETTDIAIPVVGLHDRLFNNQSNIRQLYLPETIDSIGAYTLPSNWQMKIISDAIQPPRISTNQYTSSSTYLYVRGKALQAYHNAEVWNQFHIVTEDADAPVYNVMALGNGLAEIKGLLIDTVSVLNIPEEVILEGKSLKVTSIADRAFKDNHTIRSVSFPVTLQSIGNQAFNGCYNINQLLIPTSVEEIGYKAFSANPDYSSYNNLDKIQVRGGNEYYASRNDAMLLSKDGKTLLQLSRNGATVSTSSGYIDGEWKRIEVNSLEGIEVIEPGALDGCSANWNNGNYQLCFPASLKAISGEDLLYVNNLQNIKVDTLSTTLCDIDGVLYSNDTTTIICYPRNRNSSSSENDYELPANVRTIGKYAFYNTRLNSLTLSDSLKVVEDSAFYSRYSNYYTQSLIAMSEIPAQANENAFTDYMYRNTILYIPMGTQNEYLYTAPWSNFQNINTTELDEEDFLLLKAFYEEMDYGKNWRYKWRLGESANETRLMHGMRMKDGHVFSFNLSSYGMTGKLSDKLFKLPAIETLNLSNNQLEGDIDSVLVSMGGINTSMKSLDLSYNQFSGNIGAVSAAFPYLNALNASNNKLTDVYPMLSTSISSLSINNQTMERTLDYRSLFGLSNEEVLDTIPTLLLYDHKTQSYGTNKKFTISTLSNLSDNWSGTVWVNNMLPSIVSYSNSTYKLPNHELLSLYAPSDGHTAKLRMSFEMGDVDFNNVIDIADLQKDINYALSEQTGALFNFTAGDIRADHWINVQDIVGLVNIIMEQDIDSSTTLARRGAPDNTREMAQLYWQGNKLVLNSMVDVAAMDIAIHGADNAIWKLTDDQYDFLVKKKDNNVRILHYSVGGHVVNAGETVIAEVTGDNPQVIKAELTDKSANYIQVGISDGNTTVIDNTLSEDNIHIMIGKDGLQITNGTPMNNVHWYIYTVGGLLVGQGSVGHLPAGASSLNFNTTQGQQLVVRIVSDTINVTKKISTIK